MLTDFSFRLVVFFTLLCITISSSQIFATSQDEETHHQVLLPSATSRPKIGIALSGGGARGLAHVGVLEVLEELQVPIDYIAGTSMGSIIGGLYASGLSTQALREAVEKINWKEVFSNTPLRDQLSYREKQNQRRFFQIEAGINQTGLAAPSGFLRGQQLFLELKKLTRNIDISDFSKLPIAFKAVATDLKTAEPYLLEKGDLALALRASMAVPFAFAPVEFEGHLLADGNILNNLPVDIVRMMGADIVIAVNISTPLSEIEQNSSLLSITKQAITTALIQNTRQALEKANIIITPLLKNYGTTAFDKATEIIAEGQKAVLKTAFLFDGLALSDADYQHYRTTLQHHIPETQQSVVPAFVQFKGQQRTSTAILHAKMDKLIGQPLNVNDIEQAINQLMSLNDLEQVTYRIEENKQGEIGLIFDVREKLWGPDYLRFGLNMSTTFEDKINFTVLSRHERLNINRLGAEWVNELALGTGYLLHTEFYQPLDTQRHFFLMPYAEIERRFFEVSNDSVAEYENNSLEVGVKAGINIDNVAVLNGCLIYKNSNADLRIGSALELPDSFERQEAILNVEFGYDSLDDQVFAKQGIRFNINVNIYDEQLGAEENYQELELYARHHNTIHPRATLISELILSTLLNAELENSQLFSLGGLYRLTGFTEQDVSDSKVWFIRTGGLFKPPFLSKLRLGQAKLLGLLHVGNSWRTFFEDIELERLKKLNYGGLAALVWDTRLGTVQLGASYTGEGSLSYALSLGNFLRY